MSEELINDALSDENIHELKRIRMEKLAALRAEGNDPFEITSYDVTYHSAQAKAEYEALEERLRAENPDEEAFKAALSDEANKINVSMAGRIMTRRDMGKANFINILDAQGRIQVYVRTNDVGADVFKSFKTWDIGDIVGITGFVFRTRTRDNRPCNIHHTAHKVPARAARKVARPQGHRYTLQAALC